MLNILYDSVNKYIIKVTSTIKVFFWIYDFSKFGMIFEKLNVNGNIVIISSSVKRQTREFVFYQLT